MGARHMRLVTSASLVLGGLILIVWIEGSVRGVEANTIGGVMVLLGLVSALVLVALRANRKEAAPGEQEDSVVLPRR